MSFDLTGFVRKETKVKIGTKEFTFTELSIGDLAESRAELQKQRNVLNKERRKRLLEDAKAIGGIDCIELLKLTDSPMSAEEIEAAEETVSGVGYMAYLSLRQCHADISLDDAMQIVTPSNLVEITEAMIPEDEDAKKKRLAAEKNAEKQLAKLSQ